jgi:hypothetical protein
MLRECELIGKEAFNHCTNERVHLKVPSVAILTMIITYKLWAPASGAAAVARRRVRSQALWHLHVPPRGGRQ